MTTRLLVTLCFTLVACASHSPRLSATASTIDTETVNITITLHDASGNAIADAPLEIGTEIEARIGFTDAQGQLAVDIQKSVGEQTAVVRLLPGGFSSELTAQERSHAVDRYHTLRVAHAFRPCYLIDLDGMSPYTAVVATKEPVVVSGRIVDASAQPLAVVVAARCSNTFDMIVPSEAGSFTLGGVVKNEDCEIWVSGNADQLHIVQLTAEQLAEDIDLGDIVIEDTPTDATLQLTMLNAQDVVTPEKMDITRDLTLIRSSDGNCHIFRINDNGGVFTSDAAGKATTTLPIPAGTYYIVPGGFPRVSMFALLEAIRTGKQAELDAAGAAKVTVATGGAVTAQFDAVAALNAVMAVSDGLVCPCECWD